MYLLNTTIAKYCNIYALTKLFAIGGNKEKKTNSRSILWKQNALITFSQKKKTN